MSEQSVLGKQLAAKLTAAGLNNGRLLMADDEVGEAVADAITGSGDLASLLEGLGVTNAEQALASIAELKDAKAKMDALSTELAGALAQLDQAQSAEAEADVDQAMAAKAFDPSARSALLSQRKLLTKEHGHTDGSTKFLDHYGVKPGNTDPTKDHLLSSFAADKNGRQLSPLPDRESDTDGAQVIDLAAFTGRNQTEKLVSFCASKDVAFRSKTWGDQVRHASNLRRNSTIVNG